MTGTRSLEEINANSSILESKVVRDLLKAVSFNSFVIFDLDNSVFESAEEGEFGGDQWFEALLKHACTIIPNTREAAELVLSIYHALQFHIKIKPVETDVVRIIKMLQDINIPVIAMTARSTCIMKPTLRQLNDIHLDFCNAYLESNFDFRLDNGGDASYANGILFCNGNDKGECFAKLCEMTHFYPAHVLMLDDKQKHLVSVKSIVNDYGGHFSGFRYGHLDEKVANFKIDIAMRAILKRGLFSDTIKLVMTKIKYELPEEKLHSPKNAFSK